MKKALKISGIILGSLIGIIIIIILIFSAGKGMAAKELYAQLGEKAPVITVDGESYRDLTRLEKYGEVVKKPSDEVLADVLFGKRKPMGKLPFELPYDSENPLYPFGYGLSF